MNKRERIFKNKTAVTKVAVAKDAKKWDDSFVEEVAKETKVSKNVVKRVLTTFQETCGEFVDGRVSSKDYLGEPQFATPTIKCQYKRRDVTVEEAAEILLYYMVTSCTTSRDVANKYQISTNQIYEWIRELNVSGTLQGTMVLNPKKYGKAVVKDVIWMNKHPHSKRKGIVELTDSEKLSYVRVAQILRKYLRAITEFDYEVWLNTAVAEDEELKSKRYPKKEEKKD